MTTTTEKAPDRQMSQERTAPRRFTALHTRQWMWAALFLLPSVLLLVLLRFAPMASAVTEASSLGSERELLANFVFVFSDPAFWNSLQITLIFSLIVNPLQIGLALGLAVLLTKKIPLVGLWRTLILIPVAVPQVVSAIIWLILFRPDGPLNGIARALGLPSVPGSQSRDGRCGRSSWCAHGSVWATG